MSGAGVVYFVQEVPNGPIKIGWTKKDVSARWSAIQSSNYREVRLIAVLEDVPQIVERQWHDRFIAECIRGEWFWPSEVLRKAIETEARPVVAARRGRVKGTADPTPEWVITLQKWVRDNDIDPERLAECMGCIESHAKAVLNGHCALSVPIAIRLEKASDGKLRALDLLRSTTQNKAVQRYVERNSDGGAA